jgi:hypothetical protein
MEPPRGGRQNGLSSSSSMVHPCAVGSSCNKTAAPARNSGESQVQKSRIPQAVPGKDPGVVNNQPTISAHIPFLSLLFLTSQNCGPET